MQELVLASTSASRKILLERLKIPFICAASNVDETQFENETPTQLVLRLAQEKAQAIAPQYPNAIIIGADQVGVCEDQVIGKPLTYEKATEQLKFVSGKPVKFLIGLCVLNNKDNTKQVSVENFTVTFRSLTSTMIENYLKKEDPRNCAGSFQIDNLGISLVKELVGGDYTALIGLPLIKLITFLDNTGFKTL